MHVTKKYGQSTVSKCSFYNAQVIYVRAVRNSQYGNSFVSAVNMLPYTLVPPQDGLNQISTL